MTTEHGQILMTIENLF